MKCPKTVRLILSLSFLCLATAGLLGWLVRSKVIEEVVRVPFDGNLTDVCESMLYCDSAVQKIQGVDDESIREAVLLSAKAEPRRFKGTGAGYVVVLELDGGIQRYVIPEKMALETSASLRNYPESKTRIEAVGVIDMFGNKIRVRGDRKRAVLTSPGRNGRFGDKDDIERYVNLDERYYYDKKYSRISDYNQIVDSIRRTYPPEPPATMIHEPRY